MFLRCLLVAVLIKRTHYYVSLADIDLLLCLLLVKMYNTIFLWLKLKWVETKSLHQNTSWIFNCMRKADKNEDNKMTLKELKHFLQQINIEVDDSYAEDLFKVGTSQTLLNLFRLTLKWVTSGWLIVSLLSCHIEMWHVQIRHLGGFRNQAFLWSADLSGGDRCDLWELRSNRGSDEW